MQYYSRYRFECIFFLYVRVIFCFWISVSPLQVKYAHLYPIARTPSMVFRRESNGRSAGLVYRDLT